MDFFFTFFSVNGVFDGNSRLFSKIAEYSGFLRAFVDSRELLEFFW